MSVAISIRTFWCPVPPDDPVKLVCLTVRNDDNRPRHLTATYYAEWVLGTARENAPLQVVCERDPESGAILARNAWAGDFAGKIAFVASGRRGAVGHADRTEFLGEHGSVSAPAAMRRVALSGRAGPGARSLRGGHDGNDAVSRRDERSRFRPGSGGHLAEVRRLIQQYTHTGRADAVLTACATAMGPTT